ncbi:hypothetical protein DENSPDRAFT_278187 [Dentipellis sp. KUC8613]|nr:hypothetical protein DENSPDRAFT_278187 [Dentipellis sp. KUC8613]
MCCWRRVTKCFLKCQHAIRLPDEEIQCEYSRCKFSTTHPSNCFGQRCIRSCWQYPQSSVSTDIYAANQRLLSILQGKYNRSGPRTGHKDRGLIACRRLRGGWRYLLLHNWNFS